jgi:hypothetical protein
VRELLSQISQRELAEAALRCGAYSRALMYLERHLRQAHAPDPGGGGVAFGAWRKDLTVQFERGEVEFLHRIFAGIDVEPDGLEGVARLRAMHNGGGRKAGCSGDSRLGTGPGSGAALGRYAAPAAAVAQGQLGSGQGSAQPTLVEQISELEHAARWDEALLCYEEAIDFEERKGGGGGALQGAAGPLHEGQLRCLWRAGHLELLVSLSEGKLVRRPWLRPVVVPYALDALWRLGRWGELRALLDAEGQQDLGGLKGAPGGVSAEYTRALAGAVLEAAQPSPGNGGPARLVQSAQLQVLELLSAASMESYGRVRFSRRCAPDRRG